MIIGRDGSKKRKKDSNSANSRHSRREKKKKMSPSYFHVRYIDEKTTPRTSEMIHWKRSRSLLEICPVRLARQRQWAVTSACVQSLQSFLLRISLTAGGSSSFSSFWAAAGWIDVSSPFLLLAKRDDRRIHLCLSRSSVWLELSYALRRQTHKYKQQHNRHTASP